MLDRLRSRTADIRSALAGRVLVLEVLVEEGDASSRHVVVLSPDGHASLFGPDIEDLAPHVTLRGTPEQLVSLVLGETDVFQAVLQDVLELHVPPADLAPHYPRVMRLLGEELWALLEERAGPD